jgi:restriction system protein
MAIPKFSDLFTELLEVLKADGVLHRRDLTTRVVDMMVLTEEERAATFAGGTNIARNRVHWALEFLCQAGAINRPKRGYAEITDLGHRLLAEANPTVTLERVRETDGMKAWAERSRAKAARRRRGEENADDSGVGDDEFISRQTPEEKIEDSISEIEETVAAEMLQRIKEENPVFLERAVLKLLHQMGYGSAEDDLEHLGGSGDGGVDGVINQDSLGLDQIYVQAKRYSEGTIGRPQIQAFVGALAGKHASRGIFITTSSFSRDAIEYATNLKDTRVILINGDELARLMIRFKVGVMVKKVLEIPEVDENFFESQ